MPSSGIFKAHLCHSFRQILNWNLFNTAGAVSVAGKADSFIRLRRRPWACPGMNARFIRQDPANARDFPVKWRTVQSFDYCEGLKKMGIDQKHGPAN